MFPGMNPKRMQGMLKQMGISQEEISAEKVIIEKTDGNKIIISEPAVTKIKMQGQETFQIAGEISEEFEEQGISQEDIQTIVEKTGVSEDKAKEILEKNNGDLAETILELSE